MRVTIDSKVHREKIRQLKSLDQERYDNCVKQKSRINEIFTRPPYSACEVEEKEKK